MNYLSSIVQIAAKDKRRFAVCLLTSYRKKEATQKEKMPKKSNKSWGSRNNRGNEDKDYFGKYLLSNFITHYDLVCVRFYARWI